MNVIDHLKSVAENPVRLVGGCAICSAPPLLAAAINAFLLKNRDLFLDYRDNVSVQASMQKLLYRCQDLTLKLRARSWLGRNVENISILKPLTKNPAECALEAIRAFQKSCPQLPSEVWCEILKHLSVRKMIQLTRTASFIKDLSYSIILAKLSQHPEAFQSFDCQSSVNTTQFLGWLASNTLSPFITHLDIRNDYLSSQELTLILNNVPNITSLVLDCGCIQDSHITQMVALSHLGELYILKSPKVSPAGLTAFGRLRRCKLILIHQGTYHFQYTNVHTSHKNFMECMAKMREQRQRGTCDLAVTLKKSITPNP